MVQGLILGPRCPLKREVIWLGPRSDDPLRCGLNSCHYHIYAMRNLPKFARILQRQARYCLFTAIFGFLTFYLGNWVPPPYLWRCHGWVGGAPKFFPAVFKPNEGLTVLKDWPRMAGTQVCAGWCMVLMLLVQTQRAPLIVQWGQHAGAD